MMHIHTLGAAAIDLGDTRFTPVSARRFAMLLRLAATPGEPVSRTQLWNLIFPHHTESSALHSIRELVYQFRQAGLPLASTAYGVVSAYHGFLILDALDAGLTVSVKVLITTADDASTAWNENVRVAMTDMAVPEKRPLTLSPD